MIVYVIFPYLRNTGSTTLGELQTKNIFEDFKKEPQETQEEIRRIASFFSQAETRQLDYFTYLIIKCSEDKLDKNLEKLRRSLEIYRFLVFDTEGRGIDYEHTIPYIVIPSQSNPYRIGEEEKIFAYDIYINFEKKNNHVFFSTSRGARPYFNLNIYSDDPSFSDQKEYEILLKNVKENALRSLSWYNRTYSRHLPESTEHLLRISTAFETLIKVDRKKGKEIALDEITSELLEKNIDNLSDDQKAVIIKFLQEKLIYQLSRRIYEITGSERIEKWFKQHFYPTGSTIRHGDEIELLPAYRDAEKRQKKKSLWYGEGASHHFLNNVYFGKRLFKFVFRELHFPSSEHVRKLEVEYLEKLLISDEQRLKELEKYVFEAEEGSLEWRELRTCIDLGGSYSGNRKRIFILLQRLLAEVAASFPDVWRVVQDDAEIITNAESGEIDYDDYEGFKKYYHAVIDIDSKLHRQPERYSVEDDLKLFNIKRFISFSVHRLL